MHQFQRRSASEDKNKQFHNSSSEGHKINWCKYLFDDYPAHLTAQSGLSPAPHKIGYNWHCHKLYRVKI